MIDCRPPPAAPEERPRARAVMRRSLMVIPFRSSSAARTARRTRRPFIDVRPSTEQPTLTRMAQASMFASGSSDAPSPRTDASMPCHACLSSVSAADHATTPIAV